MYLVAYISLLHTIYRIIVSGTGQQEAKSQEPAKTYDHAKMPAPPAPPPHRAPEANRAAPGVADPESVRVVCFTAAAARMRIGQGHPRESTHDRMLHLQFRCSSPSLARLEAAAWQRRYSGGAAAAGVACWGARGSVVPSIQQCGGSSMTAAVSHHQRAARPPAERVRRRLGYRPPKTRRTPAGCVLCVQWYAPRQRHDCETIDMRHDVHDGYFILQYFSR